MEWQEAIDYVAERIEQAGAVAIRGGFTGIGTARSVLGFAERIGAVIDHDASRTQDALRRTIAREGVFSATLGDIRRYADLVVLIGCPDERFPRLLDRFAAGGLVEGRSRRIVSIDAPAARATRDQTTADIPSRASFHQLPVAPERFSEFLTAARVHIEGRHLECGPGFDERTSDQLRKLADWLDAANYVAVVLGPEALDSFGPIGAEVEAGGLIASIAALNENHRAVLIGIDPSLSFRQAALWRSGFSAPVGWRQGVPGPLEPAEFGAIWESPGTARLRIHCAAGAEFARSASRLPSRRNQPRSAKTAAEILLAVEGASEEAICAADVFLPLAAPGIDLSDVVVRGDGSVNLPLKPLRSALEPTLAETLHAISETGRRL